MMPMSDVSLRSGTSSNVRVPLSAAATYRAGRKAACDVFSLIGALVEAVSSQKPTAVGAGWVWFTQQGGHRLGRPARCDRPKHLAVEVTHRSEGRFTQPHRLIQHRVEYRLKITGRGIDDLQYLGGCGLLLQCLARLGHQPRVLHRDDRLRREVLQ